MRAAAVAAVRGVGKESGSSSECNGMAIVVLNFDVAIANGKVFIKTQNCEAALASARRTKMRTTLDIKPNPPAAPSFLAAHIFEDKRTTNSVCSLIEESFARRSQRATSHKYHLSTTNQP